MQATNDLYSQSHTVLVNEDIKRKSYILTATTNIELQNVAFAASYGQMRLSPSANKLLYTTRSVQRPVSTTAILYNMSQLGLKNLTNI